MAISALQIDVPGKWNQPDSITVGCCTAAYTAMGQDQRRNVGIPDDPVRNRVRLAGDERPDQWLETVTSAIM
jgi:hypothetical protein